MEAFEEDSKIAEEKKAEQALIRTIKKLLQTFRQQDEQYDDLMEALEDETDEGKKQKYLNQRQKVLQKLEQACKDWEKLPQEDNLRKMAIYRAALPHYQEWVEELKEIEAAEQEEAVEEKERALYTKVLTDLENFDSAIEGLFEVEDIEGEIRNLARTLRKWHKATSGEQGKKLKQEFLILKTQYKALLKEWRTMRTAIEDWNRYSDEIQAARDKGEEPSIELLQDFIESNKRIQTAA